MADQDARLRRIARTECLTWYMVFPGGPLLLFIGLWLAHANHVLPPSIPLIQDLWIRYGNYFWLATGLVLLVGLWMRTNLYTPDALNRMRLPPARNLPRWFSGEGLEEPARRRMELWRKLMTRNFLLLGIIDAPAVVMVALYLGLQLHWALVFIPLYSVAVSLLYRHHAPAALVEAAAGTSPESMGQQP